MGKRSRIVRVSTLVLALALILQMMLPVMPSISAESATQTQSTNVIMNYNDWSSFEGRLAQDGDPVSVELTTRSGSNQAVKMTITDAPSAGSANVGLVPDSMDWSGAVGLQMYVKNPSDTTDLAISPRFFCNNTSGQTDFMIMSNSSAYYLISGQTITAATAHAESSMNGFVTLPAGFEGYIRMPYTSFSGGWYGTQPGNMNLAAGNLIYTTFATAPYSGMSVIIDDVSVIKANRKGNVEDFHTWFTNNAGSDANISTALVNNGKHGMSLKITIDSANAENFVNFNPVTNSWSGKGAIEMYVKNLSESPMAFQPRFFASNGTETELWRPAADTAVRFVQNEKVTAGTAADGYIEIPAGFEGQVQVPFSGYVGCWYGSTNDLLNLNQINGVYYFFNTASEKAAPGMSMLLDELDLISGLSEVTPEIEEPPAAETKPLNQFTMVETFNKWTDTSKLAYSGDPITAELVTESEGDKAMNITVTGTTTGATNAGIVGFSPEKLDWSGKEGLQIYMENPSDEQLAVSVRFIASNGGSMDMWLADHGAPIKLISGETVTDSTITYSFVFLPANFKGHVRIPFSAFTGAWYGSANATLDLVNVTSIYFAYDTNPSGSYIGKTMLVDNIALIDGMDDPIPTDPEPVETPDPIEPPVQQTKPLNQFTMVETFNKWTDTSKVALSGDPLGYELVNEAQGDNALNITVTGTTTGATNAGTLGFTPENLDWSGKAGLQIYMENPADAALAVSVRFIASNGSGMDIWLADHDAPIKLISGETVTDSTIKYGFVFLPANFAGHVRIPFSAFTGAWYGSANATLDLASVTSIYFTYDTNPGGSYIGKTMLVDNIALIDGMDDPIPTDPEPVETPEEEPPVYETKPLEEFAMVETFNKWLDLSKIAYSGDPITAELIPEAAGDNAIDLTVTGTASGATNSGVVGFTPENLDWSGKGGLQIYMENPNDAQMAVSIRFIASNGTDMEMWMAAHDSPIKLVSGETVTDSTVPYGFVFLPANFQGFVRIPFTAFSGTWYGSANSSLDLSKTTSIYFAFDTNPAGSYIGKKLRLDSISLVDTMEDPIPTGNEPLGPVPEEVETQSLKKFEAVETFNTWGDLSAVVYSGDKLKVKLFSQSSGDKALKITVKGGSEKTGTMGFTPGNTKWAGKKGLQIYMENPSDEQLAVSPRFIASNGKDMELWMPKDGTAIKLISGTTVNDSTTPYGFVFLPANFKGYVRIPFSGFTGAWYGSKSSKMKLDTVTSIYFAFDTNPKGKYIGKTLVLDTISLIKSMDEPVPGDNKEPKVPNTAGGVEYKEVDGSKFGTASSNTFTKIETFNAWGDLSRMVYSGDPVEGELVNLGEMGNALQIKITGAKSDPLNSATTGFTPENLDWSSGGGLQLYMINKSKKALPVSVRFIASNGKDMDIWLADHGTPTRLITKDNKVLDTTSFYSFVFLPANFEGYVRIPFSAFSGAWHGSKNSSLDLTQTTSIYFSFDTNPKNPYLGLSLAIDEIRLCKSLDDPLPFYEKEPEAPKKTESIKAEAAPTEPTSPKPIPPAFPERDMPVESGSAPIGWIVLAIALALMAIVAILLIVKRRKDKQQ